MRSALAAAAVIAACGGSLPSPPAAKTTVTSGLPATLEADHPKVGDPRPLHVRVYADAGVRALDRWKDDLNDQLDYAGQLLQPMLGVRLTVDAIKPWDHNSPDVRASLAELAKLDAGSDATWVIGYIAPGDTAPKAFDELGAGGVLGRHVVVRAWAERAETDQLAPSLPEVDSPQRAEVIAAHRRHKQAVVLLHELAATLGAIDEADPSWIQHPLYSSKMSTFSDRNRDLMQLAIDQRLGAGTDQTIAHDLLEAIDKQEWGGWITASHEQVTQILRNVLDSAKAGKTAADVPPAVYDQFDHVRELMKAHDYGNAVVTLDSLLAAYPANATMLEMKCELQVGRLAGAPIDKRTRDACARAADNAQGDPAPHIALGEGLAAAGDAAGARAELSAAEGKIGNLANAAMQADAWRRIVAVYVAMSALTWAEAAIAAGKLDADPTAAQVAQLRTRYGAPKGLFAPDAEGAAVIAARAAMDAVGKEQPAVAARAVAAAEKTFPRAPGVLTARCNLEMTAGAVEAARAACAAALAKAPDDSYALYLGAILDFKLDVNAANTKAGIDKLKHAIAVDPDLGPAWRALAKAYERAHDDAARAQLAQQYQAKFGQSL